MKLLVLIRVYSWQNLNKMKGGKMEIKILGMGCPRCNELEKRTIDVLADMDMAADVQKVTDLKKIAEYKVFVTPALVINGKVKCSGKIPAKSEIKKWVEEEKK